MSAFLRAFQVVLGAAQNYLALIVDIIGEDLQQSHLLGLSPRNGDHVDAESGLEIGVL